jgi:hypothetical protein
LVVGLMVVAAVAHIPVIGPHLQEARYMGVLFILFTMAALATAIALAVRPTPLLYAFAAVLCIAAVCAYVATRLIAFPMLSDDVGLWGEPLGIVSITTESAAALIALTQVRFTSPPGSVAGFPLHRGCHRPLAGGAAGAHRRG